MAIPSPALSRLLPKLKQVRERHGTWTALCPAHEDREPSLSLGIGTDGRVLVKCHAGCTTSDILGAVGLVMADLFPEPAAGSSPSRPGARAKTEPSPAEARPRLEKSYDYTDADGTLIYQACRFRYPDGRKTFRQRRPDGNGGWIWKLSEVEPVLYRLPAVLEAIAHERRLFIVEGEKDADTLTDCGYPATTNHGGAGKWHESHSAHLKDADVVILPDNDEPGRAHAEQVAASVTAAGARSVRVVHLPELPEKGDVTDWLERGRTLDELEAEIGKTATWRPAERPRTYWRLGELLENDNIMRPPPAIVPRLAWAARSTLLASVEKSGKSTLTSYVAAQVSTGGTFLGDPCQPGIVLVCGLEEFIGDVARRLRHFGADPARTLLVDRLLGDPRERPRAIASLIEELDPVLVIVDTLMAYAEGAISDATSSSQMQPLVQQLTRTAHDSGAAVVLVHHARKSDGRYRDSSAIGGAVDVIVEVFQKPEDEDTDPTKRRMRARGRVPVPSYTEIRFDGDTYRLADGQAPLDSRILEFVTSRPGCTVRDVLDGIGGRWTETQRVLDELMAKRAVLNEGSGNRRKLFAAADRPGNAFGGP